MFDHRKSTISAVVLFGGLVLASRVLAAAPFDQSFLQDYSKLQERTSGEVTDYFYAVPDAHARLPRYHGIALDQPEILMSPDSPVRGGKPQNEVAVAEFLRGNLTQRFTDGGYRVEDALGPGVLYVRLGLTDLSLKKKKRGALSYTPVGAIVKLGTDAVKEFLDKVDILDMTFQAELIDGETGEVLAALVVPREAAKKGKRMDFNGLAYVIDEYGARLLCQFDNARLPAAERVDCLDAAARDARASQAPRQ